MINVEKVIRVLGYIVYTILWSPIVILGLVVLPIVTFCWGLRIGLTIRESIQWYTNMLKTSVQHDINFIKTGVW